VNSNGSLEENRINVWQCIVLTALAPPVH